MNCTLCSKPIVLVPSAKERAAKDVTGPPASYYTNLFDTHAECALMKRAMDNAAHMARLYQEYANGQNRLLRLRLK